MKWPRQQWTAKPLRSKSPKRSGLLVKQPMWHDMERQVTWINTLSTYPLHPMNVCREVSETKTADLWGISECPLHHSSKRSLISLMFVTRVLGWLRIVVKHREVSRLRTTMAFGMACAVPCASWTTHSEMKLDATWKYWSGRIAINIIWNVAQNWNMLVWLC